MSEKLMLSENEDTSPTNGNNTEGGTDRSEEPERSMDQNQSSGLMEESRTHERDNDDLADPVTTPDPDLKVKPPLINTETGMKSFCVCFLFHV